MFMVRLIEAKEYKAKGKGAWDKFHGKLGTSLQESHNTCLFPLTMRCDNTCEMFSIKEDH